MHVFLFYQMTTLSAFFDTGIDTNKIFVTIKTKFVLRDYINKEGYSPLYLFITSQGKRQRVKTDIELNPEDWDQKNQTILKSAYNYETTNIILDNINSRITKIKTIYLLSEKTLTAARLVEELQDATPRIDFITYFKHKLEIEKVTMSFSYHKRVRAVYHKLKEFKSEILFCDITPALFEKYRHYYAAKKNAPTTISGNLATIKKFINHARRDGIKIPMESREIKVGRSSGNRIDLSPKELKRFYDFYFSEFISDTWKLVLGYFLFSAFTSIRWSNVIERPRNEVLHNDYINYHVSKNDKRHSIALNSKAKGIVKHCPELFNVKLTGQFVNRELKKIAKQLGITKKISFHTARHTFATNFLRMGGDVVKLKLIMGHSKMDTTMIYVHIVQQEANDDMALMDNLF